MTYFGAILALGFLIIVHEAGHFVVARMCGMRVERFSIGFGPALAKWRSKRGVVFQLAAIPFGGFVEIKGMNIAEDVDPDDREAYPNKPVWQRIATIFAGPGTNYLTAVVLAFGLYTCYGAPTVYYEVDSTEVGYDANGKLLPGDVIMAIDGRPLRMESGAELSAATAAIADRAATFTVRRAGKLVDVTLHAKFDDAPKMKRYRIGVKSAQRIERDRLGPIDAIGNAFAYPWRQTKTTLAGLYLAIRGDAKIQVGGAVEIGVQAKRAIKEGVPNVLELLMFLNVSLGLFNLLPLPALDGGRLAFLGYELVTRRRANPRVEMTVTMVGVLLLIVLMVFVTFKDIARL